MALPVFDFRLGAEMTVAPQKVSDLQQKNSRGVIVRQRSASILRWDFARMGFFARAALLGNSFGSEFGSKPRRLEGVHQENLANGASCVLNFRMPRRRG